MVVQGKVRSNRK